MLYGRSQCLPQFLSGKTSFTNLSQSPHYFLDILYMHETPSDDNKCEVSWTLVEYKLVKECYHNVYWKRYKWDLITVTVQEMTLSHLIRFSPELHSVIMIMIWFEIGASFELWY